MHFTNFPPSFAYDNHRIIFNYAIRELLVDILRSRKDELIESNGVKYLAFDKESYIVYISPDTKNDIFDKKQIPNLDLYHMTVAWALRNAGIYSMLHGSNPLEMAEDLSKHTGISIGYIMDTYKKNIIELDDKSKNDYGESLANLIPKLYELAKSTNQVKTDGDDGWLIDDNLKSYCSYYSVYTYHNNFFIFCSSSANMYLVEFKDDGFIIYGHSSNYGKKIEEATNPDFEWDTAEFEPYYLKHLNDNMIIMEVKNNVITVQNSLVDMLRSVVKFIAEEENIK